MRQDSKTATQIQEFVAKSGTSNGTYEYFLRYDGVSDRFEYVVTSNGNSSTQVEANANTFGSPSTGAWYFLCGGYDGANIWVSVNAGVRDTAAFSADIYDGASTNALQVGRFTGGSQYLDGALDEVVIYKRSLSLGEVSWLYNNGNGRAYADLTSGTTYTYNASHKHAVASLSTGETYTYDANGNMITRVEGGLTYNQTFDAENRLISVVVGGQTTQFVYDGDGNLVKKIKPGGSKTIYVGGVYEVDKASGGSVTRTVTYYPVAGAMRINNTLYYTLKDHLGSASVVTDATGATVSGTEQRYYPYGESRLTGTMLTDKLFTGQREMAGLGIYHYQARFYSPKLGRFLSPDTIVPNPMNPQSLNRFSYVRNNPLRYIDPTGHMETCGDAYEQCGATPPPPPPCSTCGGNSSGNNNNNNSGTPPAPISTPCSVVFVGGCSPTSTPHSPSSSSTLTTVYIGGVNPASVPGFQDDDSVPTITNIQGSSAMGIPLIISIVNGLATNPASPSDVDILLSYVTSGTGSINGMVVTVNNHNGGSGVYLSGVGITTNSLLAGEESVYLVPANSIGVNPGQIEHAVICSNCIAENVLSFNMPIDSSTGITVTALVGATYNFGQTGTNYGQLPISYTIPPR